jgi:hypothetical protein
MGRLEPTTEPQQKGDTTMLDSTCHPSITAHSILDATMRAAVLPLEREHSDQLIEWLTETIQDRDTADLERDIYVAFKAAIELRQREART